MTNKACTTRKGLNQRLSRELTGNPRGEPVTKEMVKNAQTAFTALEGKIEATAPAGQVAEVEKLMGQLDMIRNGWYYRFDRETRQVRIVARVSQDDENGVAYQFVQAEATGKPAEVEQTEPEAKPVKAEAKEGKKEKAPAAPRQPRTPRKAKADQPAA